MLRRIPCPKIGSNESPAHTSNSPWLWKVHCDADNLNCGPHSLRMPCYECCYPKDTAALKTMYTPRIFLGYFQPQNAILFLLVIETTLKMHCKTREMGHFQGHFRFSDYFNLWRLSPKNIFKRFFGYLNSVQLMVSGELAGVCFHTGFERHSLPLQRAPLDTVYPLKEHLNSVHRMVSGGYLRACFQTQSAGHG